MDEAAEPGDRYDFSLKPHAGCRTARGLGALRLSSLTGVWAHEVTDLERGCLLVETGQLLRHVKLEVSSWT